MTAELLRRAAEQLRLDAQLGRSWVGPFSVEFALATANWIDQAAIAVDAHPATGNAAAHFAQPFAVARAYLGERP
jgi:hypothetical protein